MKHQQITRVLYVVMIAVFLTTGLVIFAYSQALPARADDADPFIQYAATVVDPFTVPDTAVLGVSLLACPDYILMQNDDITAENPYPEFGLFYLPGEEIDTYDYQSLDIPSTDHIGGYLPTPDAACGLTPEGGPVFIPFFDGEANLDGGSLGPQTPN